MLTVNYITRPYFNDIALELIYELKQKCTLNVIINVSPWNIDYLGINDETIGGYGQPFELTDQIVDKIKLRFARYFEGANVILRYEEHKETSFKNTLRWSKFFAENQNILEADLFIIESLSLFADWYLLLKIRAKKIFYIIHDPVPHSGEKSRAALIRRITYYKWINKFVLYSSFSTKLFDQYFPKYAGKTITLQTPIYHNLKLPVKTKSFPEKRTVLFFGRISPYKGVELFYSAAEKLSKEFDDVLFVIAGKSLEGYSPEFLENNSNENIQILNRFIDSNTLAELMSNSSYCVLPYLDATQSGVVMTAYAYNLPVLVSDCPGLLEYCFDHANFSFKNGDLNDLIIKMRSLMQNQALLEDAKKGINDYANIRVSEINAFKILDE